MTGLRSLQRRDAAQDHAGRQLDLRLHQTCHTLGHQEHSRIGVIALHELRSKSFIETVEVPDFLPHFPADGDIFLGQAPQSLRRPAHRLGHNGWASNRIAHRADTCRHCAAGLCSTVRHGSSIRDAGNLHNFLLGFLGLLLLPSLVTSSFRRWLKVRALLQNGCKKTTSIHEMGQETPAMLLDAREDLFAAFTGRREHGWQDPALTFLQLLGNALIALVARPLVRVLNNPLIQTVRRI
mmetsp:Transcript_19569/g.54726  ORF Transcript_19569/g.54726 Transcript_19569/m.54726 type:complete len:238 (-) Transcript_19569:1069-1782(-)